MSDVEIRLTLAAADCPTEEQVFRREPGIEGVYVGYFENAYGELLVFVQRRGEPEGTLYHSDMGWEPRRISDPVDHQMVLNAPEGYWLAACWEASKLVREAMEAE